MNPQDPLPPWLRRAEPVLSFCAHLPLFECICDASARVRREGWRTPRGRRFLLRNVASPGFVFAGVVLGILLLPVHFPAAMLLLYAVPLSQIVLILKRGKRTAAENLMDERVIGDLWLAGCRGSELGAAMALRLARTEPSSSTAFAGAAAWASAVLVLGGGLIPLWESAVIVAVVFACAREMGWWASGLVAPLFLIHRARMRFAGAGRLGVTLWWAALVTALVGFVGLMNQGILAVIVMWAMQQGYSFAIGVALYLMVVTVLLMVLRPPAVALARVFQQRWLDHIDAVFDIYVRTRHLYDPDAERQP